MNKTNNKIYIGSSVDLNCRWRNHLYRLRKNIHPNNFIQNDFNKCKENAFVFEIVEFCSKNDIVEKEQIWVNKFYDNQYKCYNLRRLVSSNLGFKHSEKTKKLMSEKRKGIPPSAKCIAAAVKIRKGKNLSQETCEKIKKYQQNRSPEHRRNLEKALKERGKDLEYRKKLSAIHKERCRKLKPSDHPLFGKKHSKKSIKKMRKSHCKGFVLQFTKAGELIAKYMSAEEAGRQTGIIATNIQRVCSGKRKTAGGFIWKRII